MRLKFTRVGADVGTPPLSVYPVRLVLSTKDAAASADPKRINVLLPVTKALCVRFCRANWIFAVVLLFHVTFHMMMVAFRAVWL